MLRITRTRGGNKALSVANLIMCVRVPVIFSFSESNMQRVCLDPVNEIHCSNFQLKIRMTKYDLIIKLITRMDGKSRDKSIKSN